MSTDHGNGLRLRRVEGKNTILVLQQHNAFLSQTLSNLKAMIHVNDAFFDGKINQAFGKLSAQDAENVVVKLGLRNLAGFHCFL